MGTVRGCARCGNRRALTEGKPVVCEGRVLVLCGNCRAQPEPADEPLAIEVQEEAGTTLQDAVISLDDTDLTPPPERKKWVTPLLAAVGGLSLMGAVALPGLQENLRSDRLSTDLSAGKRSDGEAPVRMRAFEAPRRHGLTFVQIGDETEELTWYHPISGERLLPSKPTRRFGAFRDGGREDCGEGHCGVDLGGVIGTQIHAARPGQVERIVRAADAKGGRYVKLRHSHDISTYYMHLDDIHPDLVVGMELAAGDPLGTLGDSGIKRSAPHLHFQVAVGAKGTREEFVDPEDMLRQAILLEEDAPW